MAKRSANSGQGDNGGVVEAPDFEKAMRILKRDLHPAQEKVGEHSKVMSDAIKAIKKQCNVNTAAAKLVWSLAQMSEEKRDDFLRSFQGMALAFKIGITSDLVDAAEGQTHSAGGFIPKAEPETIALATVN